MKFLILTLMLLLIPTTLANPVRIKVLDQHRRDITKYCLIKSGNETARLVGEYAVLNLTEKSYTEIYFRGVIVYSFIARPNMCYNITAMVSDLVIQAPRDLLIYITILATNETMEINTVQDQLVVLKDIPFGLIRIKVVGSKILTEVINFQGGTVVIKEKSLVYWNKLIPALAASLIPILVLTIHPRRKKRLKKKVKKKEKKEISIADIIEKVKS